MRLTKAQARRLLGGGGATAKAPSKAAVTRRAKAPACSFQALSLDLVVLNAMQEELGSAPHVCFRVDGAPVPKRRARTFFDKRVGKIVSKTPEETESYESLVANLARAACLERRWPLGGWPSRDVRYVLRVEVMAANDRADADNYAKITADGLNKIAWPDDRRICNMVVSKRVVEPEAAGLFVMVWAIGPTGGSAK